MQASHCQPARGRREERERRAERERESVGCRLIRYPPTNVITDFAAEKREEKERRKTHQPFGHGIRLFFGVRG